MERAPPPAALDFKLPPRGLPSRTALTTGTCGISLITVRGVDVKRYHLILVLFLLAAAVCVFAVPRPDLPETTFNEADAPVNLAPPVLPRIQIVRPALNSIAVLPALPDHCAVCVASRLVLEPAASPRHRDAHSLLALLCTFLI